MNSTINVCLASDDGYTRYMGLTILSILRSAAPEDRFNFYILGDKISKKSRDEIESLKKIRDFEINWLDIDISVFKEMQKNLLSYITYARLLSAQYINEDKIIYLDSDTYVRTSLAPLFNEDIEGYYAGAVVDYCLKSKGYSKKVFSQDLRQIDNDLYFNAGVLLINLKLWRQDNIQEQFMIKGKDPSWKYDYADQDLINMVLRGRIKSLDPRWNVMNYFYLPDLFLKEEIFNKIPQIIKDPYIRHFKGWQRATLYPQRDEYYKMMLESPWREFAEPDDPKFVAYTKKFFRYMWKHPFCFLLPKFYKRWYYRGFLGLIRS